MPSKLKNDFRIYFAIVYSIIAGIIIFTQRTNLNLIHVSSKAFWCLSFCLLGFAVLILKICINELVSEKINPKDDDNLKMDIRKKKLRYYLYYPIMLIVMSVLSCVISKTQFNKTENDFLISAALLSFFLGFFIDSLTNIVEKLSGKIGGKE